MLLLFGAEIALIVIVAAFPEKVIHIYNYNLSLTQLFYLI